jgi:2-haloacid dehalogenase
MSEIRGVVFDLYGTLYDVHSVVSLCDELYPGRGREISALWRQKQLEYTWLRSLMGKYASFEEATEHALNYCSGHLKLALDDERREKLCEAYLRLQPFPEVPAALRALNAQKIPLAILSNGSVRSIDSVVRHSGLLEEFAHLISVEEVRVFKPDPRVYELAEHKLRLPRASILFVSSNAWDATGAGHFGFPTCWVNRSGNTFEEMGQRPKHTVNGIDGVLRVLASPPG